MNQTPLVRRLLASAAGLAIGSVGALALAAPSHAQDQTDVTPSSVEFENTCDGTLVTLNSGTELEEFEWYVVVDDEWQDGALIENLATGESKTVLAPWQWTDIIVYFVEIDEDGVAGGAYDDPVEWTWEAPEDCPPRDEHLPEELGQWQFNCEEVEITFVNPWDETESFHFAPSVGEAQEVEIPGGESATLVFPSSEGLTIEIRGVENGNPGVLMAELEISSEAWVELNCGQDEDSGDGEGGELPVTGASTGLLALGAVALLAVGGGLFLVARRRRTTFSA